MVGFEEKKGDLDALGVAVFAASVETGEQAAEVGRDIAFALGEGVGREVGNALGAWWNDDRDFIQPSQFVFRKGWQIVQSTYSDGSLGRLDAGVVAGLVGFLKKA